MKHYSMIIYTASDQSYADSVISHIDPMNYYFKHRLYRHNCVKVISENGPIYIKDLRIIKNVKLSDMIIIDNSVLSFAFHLDNGIPILPYYNNKEDNEMIHLKNYLKKLIGAENIALKNGENLNFKRILEETKFTEEKESKETSPSKSTIGVIHVKNDDSSKMKTDKAMINIGKEKKSKKEKEELLISVGGKQTKKKKSVREKIFDIIQVTKGEEN